MLNLYKNVKYECRFNNKKVLNYIKFYLNRVIFNYSNSNL